MHLLRLILALLMALPLSACALSGGSVSGRVLEEGTGKPLTGAIVVVRWIGHTTSGSIYVEARDVCYHVETATTDERGAYQTKAWSQEQHKDYTVKFDHMLVDTYQRDYGFPQTPSQKDGIVYLAPFKGAGGERLKYLERMLDATRCGSQNDTERNLHALYYTMYEEAKSIAVSKEDAEIVDTLRYWASFVIFDKNKPMTRDAKGRLINVDPKGK